MSYVFVSYKRENSDLAEQVKKWIADAGLDYWIDQENIYSGERWEKAIDKGILDCFALVVIMTPLARLSDQVTYEWIFALGTGKEVIPLRVDIEYRELHQRMQNLNVLDFHSIKHQEKLIQDLSLYEQNAQSSIYIPPHTPKNVLNLAQIAYNSGADFDTTRDYIRKLAQIENHDARTIFISGLDHNDPIVKKITLDAMYSYQIIELEAAPKLIQFLTFQHGHRIEQAVSLLASMGSGVLEKILPHLNDEDVGIRTYLCKILGKIADPNTVYNLIDALNDESPSVRREVAKALGEMKDERAVLPLIDNLKEENYETRIEIESALVNIGHSAVEPLIKSLISGGKYRAYIYIPAILQRIHSSSFNIISQIIPLFDLNDDLIRKYAAEILNSIKSNKPQIVETFMKHLNDDYWEVRAISATALAGIGIVQSISKIKDMAIADPNEQVRVAADHSIQIMAQKQIPEASQAQRELKNYQRSTK
jgi:HEAT repeat protein